jgi:hypothetical protein
VQSIFTVADKIGEEEVVILRISFLTVGRKTTDKQ